MDLTKPLSVEPLDYEEMPAACADSVAVRVVAMVGIVVGCSRVGSALVQGWMYGLLPFAPPAPYRTMSLTASQRVLLVGDFAVGIALGLMLLLGVIGLIRGSRRARQVVLISELCQICLRIAVAILQVGTLANTSSSLGAELVLYQALSWLTSLGGSLAFSFVAVLILWKRTRPEPLGRAA